MTNGLYTCDALDRLWEQAADDPLDTVYNLSVDELIVMGQVYDPNKHSHFVGELIKDHLISTTSNLGRALDRLNGVDPGTAACGSTRDHRSFTYKIRKIMGYSYP